MNLNHANNGGAGNARAVAIAADEARQAETVLRTPLQVAIFIAGLAGFVLLSLLMAVAVG